MAPEKMRALDDVAYVRFASVYREFQAADEFVKEIQAIGSDIPSEAPATPVPLRSTSDRMAEPTI